jgi:hypothetical protein
MSKRVLVLTLCLVVMASLAVFGAKQPTTGKVIKPATLDQEGRNVISRYILTPTPKVFLPFTGDTVGFTYHDYWHNDGQRRSIARDGLGGLHFEWCVADAALDVFSIYYNYYSGGTWLAAGTGIQVPGTEGAGGGGGKRPSMDLLPDDREVLAYRMYANPFNTAMSVEKATAGLGEFDSYDLPDSIPGASTVSTWPYIATSKVKSGDTTFIFVTGSQNSSAAGTANYTRCFFTTDSTNILYCQAPSRSLRRVQPNSFQQLKPNSLTYQFDPSRNNVTALPIATSPVSKKIAIAWDKQVASASKQEVVYLESTNNGSDWQANGNMGTLHQITNYGPTYAIQNTQSDNDVIYDYKDDLHIAWVTGTATDGDDNTLWHWNKSSGIISKITRNAYTGPSVAFNRGINKVNLAITEQDSNYLYITYIKYSNNDLSAANYPNGELYLQASSNGGRSWGPPVNLSNTQDSGCTAGNCRAEAYPSMAKYVDDSLFVFYLFDLDAGAADYSTAEGAATNSPARYIGIPRPSVPSVPGLYYAPSQLTSPIEWATNHSSKIDSIKFDNTGTATLQVQLSGPSWLTPITPSIFSIAELGATQKVTLTLNGGPYADTFLTGKLKILSNNGVVGGGANFNDTQYVDINFVVTDTFYFAEFDTCKRGPVLVVSNVSNMGGQSDSAGMFYKGLNYLFEGSALMVTNQVPGFSSDNVGFSWIHEKKDFIPEGNLVKVDYPSLKTTVYIDKFALLNWRRPSSDPAHWAWFGWTKWSKIIQFDWVPGKIHAVLIKNWWTWNRPPKWWNDIPTLTAPAGGYFGIGADWDVTASFSGKDKGGIIDSLNLVYVRQDTVNTDKYYGGYQFLSAYVKKGTTTNYTTPFAMHVGRNKTQMYPFSGYDDDSLWKYMSMPGDFIEQDSAQDMNLYISAVEMLNPDTTTEIGIDYTAIVSDSGLADFVRQAATLKKVKPGDANVDGKVTVSDVVYLVNYLFKGGPEPWLLFSDANGDAKVTVSDVVYLVNYLFKGGPPAIFIVGAKPF